MGSPVQVVRVEASDLESIMKMANLRLKEEYTIELFQHFFEIYGGCFLAVKDLEGVVGFILAVPLDVSTLRVLMLVVLGTKVRRGLGSTLMRSAEIYAASRKITSIVLEVGTKNEVALEFYKILGFEITGMIPEYYNDKSDAFVMRKFLPM